MIRAIVIGYNELNISVGDQKACNFPTPVAHASRIMYHASHKF
jgi:hypothetical protein